MKQNTNEMTYRELAELLAECGITGIREEVIAELETQWQEFPPEALDSLDKVTLLLSAAGEGRIDMQTRQWLPTSGQVYSFDMEAFDVADMYAILLRGIEAIGRGQIQISGVVQNDGEGYYDRSVAFSLNGKSCQFKPEFGGDWYDTGILDALNRELAAQGIPDRLYVTTDGYQQVIVFFCDARWAADFMQKTGCVLRDRIN